MFLVLVLSSLSAFAYGPTYDEVLVVAPTFERIEAGAIGPLYEVEAAPLLHGAGVIDLHAAPVTMPTASVRPLEPTTRTSADRAAVQVEVHTRDT